MRHKAKKSKFWTNILLAAPIKILSKLKNFYMNCMADCATNVGDSTGAAGYCPMSQVTSIPRRFSFSTSSKTVEDEEGRELLISASKERSVSEDHESNYMPDLKSQAKRRQTNYNMGRNYDVAVGKIWRIEEDEPCYFEEDLLYSVERKSCALEKDFTSY